MWQFDLTAVQNNLFITLCFDSSFDFLLKICAIRIYFLFIYRYCIFFSCVFSLYFSFIFFIFHTLWFGISLNITGSCVFIWFFICKNILFSIRKFISLSERVCWVIGDCLLTLFNTYLALLYPIRDLYFDWLQYIRVVWS